MDYDPVGDLQGRWPEWVIHEVPMHDLGSYALVLQRKRILVDPFEPAAARRYTLATVCAHLDLGVDTWPINGPGRTMRDTDAEVLALKRLMPLRDLYGAWLLGMTDEETAELFNVPAISVHRRYEHLSDGERRVLIGGVDDEPDTRAREGAA